MKFSGWVRNDMTIYCVWDGDVAYYHLYPRLFFIQAPQTRRCGCLRSRSASYSPFYLLYLIDFWRVLYWIRLFIKRHLTHWCQVTLMCVSEVSIRDSGSGSVTVQHHATPLPVWLLTLVLGPEGKILDICLILDGRGGIFLLGGCLWVMEIPGGDIPKMQLYPISAFNTSRTTPTFV